MFGGVLLRLHNRRKHAQGGHASFFVHSVSLCKLFIFLHKVFFDLSVVVDGLETPNELDFLMQVSAARLGKWLQRAGIAGVSVRWRILECAGLDTTETWSSFTFGV